MALMLQSITDLCEIKTDFFIIISFPNELLNDCLTFLPKDVSKAFQE